MVEIYFEKDGSVKGPYPADQLKALAKQGVISPETVIWKNGSDKKFIASNIRGLFQPEQTEDFLGIGINKSNETPQIADFGAQSVSAVRDQASQFVQDLKEVDFKDEVFPIDQTLIKKMIEDSVFWIITALAGVPLIIATLEKKDLQLTAFALFFAVLWGFIFKSLVIKNSEVGLGMLSASLFFTGFIGISLLLFLYGFLPKSYMGMAESDSSTISLLGYIFQVGLCEEVIKILPVFAYILVYRKKADPLKAVLIGIFSGLGFAAFENMTYGQRAINISAILAKEGGQRGAAVGTQMAMVTVLLRSLSLVFCHATWSGIFAYFVAIGFASGKRCLAMFVIGLAVSAILHGAYDWLTGIQLTIATGVVILSFVMFYAYLIKLKEFALQEPTTTT